MTSPQHTLLALGSYQPENGLVTCWWDGETGITPAGTADIDSPSFVCWHPSLPVLYAVSGLDQGLVTTLAVADDGALTTLATTPTGGATPCWVTTDPAGTALLIANYSDGTLGSSMTVIGLGDDGVPAAEIIVMPHSGSGPVADRQTHAHVHQVVPTADGHVLASDLGADELVEYRIEPIPDAAPGQVRVTKVGAVTMPAGSGPRHIALAADGITGFVSGELDGTVTTIRRALDSASSAGRWSVTGQVPCAGQTASKPETVYPSHVALTGTNRYLLVANRGPNTLTVLDVSKKLAIIAEAPVADGPRAFALDNGRVLVACQHADTVEVHSFDDRTGTVARLGELTVSGESAPPLRTPSCVAVRHVLPEVTR